MGTGGLGVKLSYGTESEPWLKREDLLMDKLEPVPYLTSNRRDREIVSQGG
jgi:hypothetical protein